MLWKLTISRLIQIRTSHLISHLVKELILLNLSIL